MTKEVVLKFTKRFRNEWYELLFNKYTGLEMLQGINGNSDPFALELPSLLDIGIMGTCEHKCPFCYQGHEDRPNMKLGHFMSVIDQVKHHVNQVALGGRGDPNKHPQFKEIVEYCTKNNVVPNYTTSGISLTDDEVEISKMCEAVAVSDYERGYTYTALKKFIDAGIKTNIHQIYSYKSHLKCDDILDGVIPDIWDLFDHSKLNAVIFLLFKPQGAGKNLDWKPTTEQITQFASKIFNPKSSFKVGMDSCLVNHILKYSNPTTLQRMSVDTCEAGRMSGYITPDMKFKPCSFAEKNTEVDLLETSIEKAWKYKLPFQNFRKILHNKNNCCPIGL